MLRYISSIIAGVLIGFFAISLIEALGHFITPPPEGVNITDAESISAYMKDIPLASLLMVWLAYIIGSFVAGLITAVLLRKNQLKAAVACGVLILAAGALNLYLIPHPLWFSIGTILTYIPFAVLGAHFGKKIKERNVI